MSAGLNQLLSSLVTAGILPEPFTVVDLVSRDFLVSRASKIYKQKINLVARLDSETGPLVIKLFGWRNPLHFLLSPASPSRAELSWQTANRLVEAGVRTPEPLFVYTQRKYGFIFANLYISRCLEQHQSLRQFLNSKPDLAQAEMVIVDLAKNLSNMHEGGILHRDLTPGNVLIDNQRKTYLVDLNRTIVCSKLTVSQRLRDLAKLNFKYRQPHLEQPLVEAFFQVYSRETNQAGDWVKSYGEKRQQLLNYRRRKAVLKRLRFNK